MRRVAHAHLTGLIFLFAASGAHAQGEATREAFAHGDRQRSFFLYVPDTVKPDTPAPLLIALHGSDRDGASIVNPWKALATREGIIIVGPDSADKAGWNLQTEGPDFFQALVEAIKAKRSVDPRRMFLFGHSAGAIASLMMGLLESEYFAAVAVHAGLLPKHSWDLIANADRKIPIAIWVGTNDRLFPLTAVVETKTVLERKGFSVQLRPINNHDHNYYGRSDEVNSQAWAFLKSWKLDHDPKFKQYDIK